MSICALLWVVVLLLLLPSVFTEAQESTTKISTVEELKEEFGTVPCENRDRLQKVKSLFERVGTPPSDITIDKYKEVENLVVIKKGASSEKIVLGAHYDKVEEGCGAIDNWTGIVTLAHIYKTLRDIPLKKTLVFVAFGSEENGLIGSKAMTKSITKETAVEYCAMINIDSLGMAAPQVADNMSTKKLTQLAQDVAQEMKMPFAHASIKGADSDSSPFILKKIAAVTIHGMSTDWPHFLHSKKDQSSAVNPTSVYLGYRLVLDMIRRLEDSQCGAFN